MPTLHPTPIRPEARASQARRGNQNARSHGLYSRLDPPSLDELATLARSAAADEDLTTLRGVARAFQARGERERARQLRALVRRFERDAVSAAADQILVTHRARGIA